MDPAIDSLPLGPAPRVDDYQQRATRLRDAHRRGEPAALQFIKEHDPRFGAASVSDIAAAAFSDADASAAVARQHGFESWAALIGHVQGLADDGSGIACFEAAIDAIVGGDLDQLSRLLEARHTLVLERSSRIHHATLLHYVAANGVENYRQQTPPNAVAIAGALLGAGAQVDALADTYGGGTAQTTMNLLVSSVHPARAGVQEALVDTLLDFGAAIDGVEGDGSPLLTALAFEYPASAEALARRGATIDTIIAAAGLGRVDLVERLFDAVPTNGQSARWLRFPADPAGQRAIALAWAAKLGRAATVRWLLERGVDPAAPDDRGWTALHWATFNGHVEIAHDLVAHGAPLEALNEFGGTVLDGVLWGASHPRPSPIGYVPVVDLLVAAGAAVHRGWLDPALDPPLPDPLKARLHS